MTRYPMPVAAFIGLGSNLDDPHRQLCHALQALDATPGVRRVATSSAYRSPPLGPPGQPDYLNAVVQVKTTLPPQRLLDALHAIEAAQGRVRLERWGPRTLDLDLLLYGDQCIHTPILQVPHPRLHERVFVLDPLREVAPEQQVPGQGSVAELAERLMPDGTQRLGPLS